MTTYTQAELDDIVKNMEAVSERVYWHMFSSNIGGSCHAMMEFCGLMSMYVKLCRAASRKGIQFPFINTHSGTAIPMELHDVEYLAEKFDCIFGAFFKANPKAARLFAEKALGLSADGEGS